MIYIEQNRNRLRALRRPPWLYSGDAFFFFFTFCFVLRKSQKCLDHVADEEAKANTHFWAGRLRLSDWAKPQLRRPTRRNDLMQFGKKASASSSKCARDFVGRGGFRAAPLQDSKKKMSAVLKLQRHVGPPSTPHFSYSKSLPVLQVLWLLT